MEDVTMMIKTMLRPGKLRACLESIQTHYPTMPIIILDDSPQPYPDVARDIPQVRQYQTFTDHLGTGACYNWALDHIETDFMLLGDDDFVFTEETKVELLRQVVRDDLVDLCGGAVRNTGGNWLANYVGDLFIGDAPSGRPKKALYFNQVDVRQLTELTVATCIPNFWVCRSEIVRRVRWDPALKVCRHEDFFLRLAQMGFVAAYLPWVVVDHDPGPDQDGGNSAEFHRRRHQQFNWFRDHIFLPKWGLDPEEGWQIGKGKTW